MIYMFVGNEDPVEILGFEPGLEKTSPEDLGPDAYIDEEGIPVRHDKCGIALAAAGKHCYLKHFSSVFLSLHPGPAQGSKPVMFPVCINQFFPPAVRSFSSSAMAAPELVPIRSAPARVSASAVL